MSDLFTELAAPRARTAAPHVDHAVTILLATYNGATFLPAQLQSLLDQTDTAWRLLWRDDGSTDRTVALMEDFVRICGGRTRRIYGPEGRLGVAGSYHELAQHAPLGHAIAFCDQDDVWLPGKLARAHAAIANAPPGRPALYCARQVLVDDDLRPLATSLPVRWQPDFFKALAQNIATGCTVVMNPEAAALFRAIPPPRQTLHDWWSYLLVAAAGGKLIIDDEPVILYRQHGGNFVGAPHTRWRRALLALRRGPSAFMNIFRAHIAALAEHADLITPDAAAAAQDLRQVLAAGPANRLRALRRYPMRRQTWLESALFAVWFLIG